MLAKIHLLVDYLPMSQSGKLNELERYGCTDPSNFLSSHIPRYAEHFGITYEDAFGAVLAEIVALDEVRTINFQEILESGLATKVLKVAGERGIAHLFGELPMVVQDAKIYRGIRDPETREFDWFDPTVPLTIGNFHRMVDLLRNASRSESIDIGRPNSAGELWLSAPFEPEDYDVVVSGFKRLVALRTSGITPHLERSLEHIYIPYTLGAEENPYDPSKITHDPVDYTGLAAA